MKHLKEKAVLNIINEDDTFTKSGKHLTPNFALLLQAQLKNVRRKKKGRRWQNKEKIIALRLYKRSPTCYRLLKRLFCLPAPSTLKSLLNQFSLKVGVHEQVLEVLKKLPKLEKPSDNEYTLMWDEMSLRKHIEYNIKDDLIEVYEDHSSQGRSQQHASHALVFMISGLRKTVKQPIAHYFSSEFSTADRLNVLIKEVLHCCFNTGLNIAAVVCDMYAVNRRALSSLGATAQRPIITVDNKETSRVLNSTFRYVKFVKRLRAQEEEQRKGTENKLKELKDQQISDFFTRCDRRSLINNVARRVDLCMASYQEDLTRKRQRLIRLYSEEEEGNIRKFVEQAQAGREAVWQDKKNRLQYLLEKRKKEHAEKYKDTPLSKCVHVLPCIYKLRAKEAADIQLYQIREKEARKMAEREFEKMWHEVAMKESEALKARMEQDAIERYRKDLECKQYSDMQVEQNRLRREKEREMLKEEAKRFKAIWEEDIKKEEEAELKRQEKRKETARERAEMIKERKLILEKQEAETRLIADTWDSLAGQGLADEKAKIELARKKERENDECNKKVIELKNEIVRLETANDGLIEEEARRYQNKLDAQRCAYKRWSEKTNADVRKTMIDQIKDHQASREIAKKKTAERDEYERQVFGQMKQLTELKDKTDAQRRKEYQNQLLAQMEYNKTLKERARQEEIDQMKKYQIATEEYQKEIQKMLCRPFFSDEVHPFMKQMAKGLKMQEKCPCSKPDYCQ